MKVRLIRKEEYKSYFISPLIYGPLLGLIIYLVALVDNEFSMSVGKSFVLGIAFAFGLQLFGFIIMEMFVRGNQIKKLQTENFKILDQYGIYLMDDLVFRGKYKGFWIHIFPNEEVVKKRKKLYFVINSYYDYPDYLNDKDSKWDFDKANCNKYEVGTINFGGNAVANVPNDKYNPDFKSSIDFLISKLQELELKPLDFKIWEDNYIRPIKEKQEKEEQKRTKQIFKIGNIIDIKYKSRTHNNL